jgi:hypothetical protein
MLHRFTARRYRNVDVDDLALGRLNLLVGPNNAGKSNFIRAVGFLGDLLIPRDPSNAFLSALNTRGRGDLLDRESPVPGDIDLAWTLSPASGARALTYEIGFKVDRSEAFPSGFYITKERLRDAEDADDSSWLVERDAKSPGTVSFPIPLPDAPALVPRDVSPQETLLQQRDAMFLGHWDFAPSPIKRFAEAVRDLRAYFGGVHAYVSSRIDPENVAQGVRRDVLVKDLDPDGRHLANVLRYLDQHDGLDDYVRLLGQAIPDLRRVKPYDVSDESVSVRLDIDGRWFKLSEMSEGTIKAMILALLVSTPVRRSLLCIDEPELNLHPAWLHILGKWLLECRSADQLMISTHSPEILDSLTPAFREGKVTLFVFKNRPRGVRRVEQKELDAFFDEGWELGDLYRVGEPKLGGWPW